GAGSGGKDQREERELQAVRCGGEQAPEVVAPERPPFCRGRGAQVEERFVPSEAPTKRGKARGELRQEQEAKQGRRPAARLEPGGAGHGRLGLGGGRRGGAGR